MMLRICVDRCRDVVTKYQPDGATTFRRQRCWLCSVQRGLLIIMSYKGVPSCSNHMSAKVSAKNNIILHRPHWSEPTQPRWQLNVVAPCGVSPRPPFAISHLQPPKFHIPPPTSSLSAFYTLLRIIHKNRIHLITSLSWGYHTPYSRALLRTVSILLKILMARLLRLITAPY